MSQISVHTLPGARIPKRQWEAWLRAMLAACPAPSPAGLTLVLLRDGDMAKLNAGAMAMVGPTNILSFPEHTPMFDHAPHTLGELYLSLDTLVREAYLYDQPYERHAQRLLAHGLAHLLGFDHSREMEKLEELLLGVPVTL